MWAQLIKVRLKPDKDTEELNKQLRAADRSGKVPFAAAPGIAAVNVVLFAAGSETLA